MHLSTNEISGTENFSTHHSMNWWEEMFPFRRSDVCSSTPITLTVAPSALKSNANADTCVVSDSIANSIASPQRKRLHFALDPDKDGQPIELASVFGSIPENDEDIDEEHDDDFADRPVKNLTRSMLEAAIGIFKENATSETESWDQIESWLLNYYLRSFLSRESWFWNVPISHCCKL